MSELVSVRLVSNRVKVNRTTELVTRQTKRVLPKFLKRVKTGKEGNKPCYDYFAVFDLPRYMKRLNGCDPNRMIEVPVDKDLNPDWMPPKKGWSHNQMALDS